MNIELREQPDFEIVLIELAVEQVRLAEGEGFALDTIFQNWPDLEKSAWKPIRAIRPIRARRVLKSQISPSESARFVNVM